ncbi:3-phenylpropionate MFS transporter [Rhodovibrio sodomensis]|uniref:3-phenylpropionate MFS transporter n=1 Tax=Rhodovibrio sodomensis TaxID=1088 RepID=A0ABS1DEV8_9PROT|nr:3-phenylpropionate MFS transporter [Rhodovibrio sodomensis]MBK1668481.1 3-phenylpropionate MFS transporter [Rhodovibrio sodomensis]
MTARPLIPEPARLRAAMPFALFYGAVFVTLGVYLPFWPVFLESRELSGAEIGTVLALGTWMKTAINPLAGQLADRTGRRRTVLAALALTALVAGALFTQVAGFWAVLAVHLLLFPTFHATIPIGESQTMAAVAERGFDYGRLRLWGSLAFILGVLGVGDLLTRLDPDAVLYGVMAGLVLVVLAARGLPPVARPRDRTSRAPLSALLGQRRFLLFLAIGSLLQASHAVYYGFSAVHWQAAGLSPATVGWLWSEGVVAEVLLFAAGAALLARLGPVGLLALAAAAGVLRWGLLAWTTELAPLIAVQALHAFTFGAAHLGAMHYIARSAPPGLQATAQGVYAGTSGGIVMGATMLGAGWLYDVTGGGAFLAMAAMSAAAGALAWPLLRAERRRPTGGVG